MENIVNELLRQKGKLLDDAIFQAMQRGETSCCVPRGTPGGELLLMEWPKLSRIPRDKEEAMRLLRQALKEARETNASRY